MLRFPRFAWLSRCELSVYAYGVRARVCVWFVCGRCVFTSQYIHLRSFCMPSLLQSLLPSAIRDTLIVYNNEQKVEENVHTRSRVYTPTESARPYVRQRNNNNSRKWLDSRTSPPGHFTRTLHRTHTQNKKKTRNSIGVCVLERISSLIQLWISLWNVNNCWIVGTFVWCRLGGKSAHWQSPTTHTRRELCSIRLN